MPSQIIKLLEDETEGKFYRSFRYCADEEIRVPTIAYDDRHTFTVKDKFGETDTSLKEAKNLHKLADKILTSEPLFSYFLDGSRRTYKVDDLEKNKRIFPVMAGQVGFACCQRKDPSTFKVAEAECSLVLSLPSIANSSIRNPELFLNNLKEKINQSGRLPQSSLKFSKILTYNSSPQDESKKYEHLGIATIQDEMIETEKRLVATLYTKNLLSPTRYLLKDGSLQYKPMKTGEFKELARIKNHYRRVVGASKLFNPELCKDKNNKNIASKIAAMPLYHRTPAYMYGDEHYLGDVKFSIWYVRIRESKRTESPFSGVLKLEKVLVTDDEIENGLDSDEVDFITANIINERNPVCYGKDARWANHLYPIYLTESFIKSKYISDLHFLNLF